MQVSERDRHELYEWAKDAMGENRADILMQYLPPVGWGDIATRRDLDILRAELRAEHAQLRAEFGELRGEFGELRGEFGELRGEHGSLRAEMAEGFRRQTALTVTSVVGIGGLIVGLFGIALAVG